MEQGKKKVSVIMCAYNETAEELKQAIQSILQQTFREFELLIVLDNPENQELWKILSAYALQDPRIRLIKNEKNLGVAESTNRAWKQAEGEYIAKMDADDIADPRRLEIEIEALEKEGLDFVAASKQNIDENGKSLGLFVNELNTEQLKKLLPYDNLITQSTVLMKKTVLKELGGYLPLPSCEDYDLWIRMMCSGYKMAVLPVVLVDYRVRKTSITRTDYYRQYRMEQIVKTMYRRWKKTGELWSRQEMEARLEAKQADPKKRDRFNAAYQNYYQGMEARKLGQYGRAVKLVTKAVSADPRVLDIFIKKLMFHLRKRFAV